MFISQIKTVFVAKRFLNIFNSRLYGMVPVTVSLAPDLPAHFPLPSTWKGGGAALPLFSLFSPFLHKGGGGVALPLFNLLRL